MPKGQLVKLSRCASLKAQVFSYPCESIDLMKLGYRRDMSNQGASFRGHRVEERHEMGGLQASL